MGKTMDATEHEPRNQQTNRPLTPEHLRAKAWLQVSALLGTFALSACGMQTEDEGPGNDTQSLVFGTDNRASMTDAFFTANPKMRAIGLLDIGGSYCTATHFVQNYVLTARHCIGDTVDPKTIVFRPAFVGSRVAANYAQRPQIVGRRVIRGTGYNGHINADGTYVPGGDWFVVELDPSSYVRGTPAAGSGIPSFPSSFSGWATIPIASAPRPIPTSGVTVTDVGYSGDKFTASGYAGIHQGCTLKKDAFCSSDATQHGEGFGPVITDCDFNPGASGGPLFTGSLSNPAIVAINGGGGDGSTPTWTEANANRVISSNAWAFAPLKAAGFTATKDSGGTLIGLASDALWTNGIRWVNMNSSDGYRAADQWYDWRDSGTTPVALQFGRLTSTTTIDNHAWYFAIASGQIWNKIESGLGQWISWQTWFPGTTMGTNPVDIVARSAGSTSLQLYTIQSDGSVRTRRKMNTWDGNWEGEVSLGTVSGAIAIAASNTGGFQQIFVATPSSIQSKWEINGASSNQWSGWQNLADGLPTGTTIIDLSAGLLIDGRMVVYMLCTVSGQTRIYSRAKNSAQPGSVWDGWHLFGSDPEIAGASQIEMETGPSSLQGADHVIVNRNGELLVRRYSTSTMFTDKWVPFYSPATVRCP
jgi:hypothetical protein